LAQSVNRAIMRCLEEQERGYTRRHTSGEQVEQEKGIATSISGRTCGGEAHSELTPSHPI